MLGYQPCRCMKHNLIADVVMKLRWFLTIIWEHALENNLRFFLNIEIVKGPKSNIFTCKLCSWVIFLILLAGLLCDNLNSLTYKQERGKVRHFHVQTVWFYISCLLFKVMIVTWTYENLPSFATSASSKGFFLLGSNNL